ncbi:helix-turn-helix domain-containing protein [Clostridium sp. MCC353]|uniref:AraC family transcriptional regulator n=1 Tax=Clostridium sp. MCC353 TaxID=2592646 RepID=UPI001C01E2CC|nr:AraC family transcriptional regulator [Clostridium sp. MCC353]MBT9778526.1 helix-turn-helix domain-containing protein [Clostridium sp. MCC353]
MKADYELSWPGEELELTVYAHELARYSFHWHEAEYEIDIILRGKAEFCCEGNIYTLEADDVIVINCGDGHGSFTLEPNTISVVLRFSAAVLQKHVTPGSRYQFHCISNEETRYQPGFCRIRYFIAQILEASMHKHAYSRLTAKASMELILSTLYCFFSPSEVPIIQPKDKFRQKSIRNIIKYIDRHYSQKITLEDLARISKYNKTYVSTFFKLNVGMNFYEYLTRVRFMKALGDLDDTNKNLTEIAIDNGFPDLKSFNYRFRDVFHMFPSEYRLLAADVPLRVGVMQRRYCDTENQILQTKLAKYLWLDDRPST